MNKEELRKKVVDSVLFGDFRNEQNKLVIFNVKNDYEEKFLSLNNIEEEIKKIEYIYNIENIDFIISETTCENLELGIAKLTTTLTIYFKSLKNVFISSQTNTITCFIDENYISCTNLE